MKQAIRIDYDFKTFFEKEHPEVKFKFIGNKIISIQLPEDAQVYFLLIVDYKLIKLEYSYKGEFVRFPVN